jgi:hypothetical protein
MDRAFQQRNQGLKPLRWAAINRVDPRQIASQALAAPHEQHGIGSLE